MSTIYLRRNRECRDAIDSLAPFKGSNIFGQWEGDLYVAYSYGRHFPMVVYDRNVRRWFHNIDKYSLSTSRHQMYAGRPGEPRSTDDLRRLVAAGGVVNVITERLEMA